MYINKRVYTTTDKILQTIGYGKWKWCLNCLNYNKTMRVVKHSSEEFDRKIEDKKKSGV